MSNDNPEEIEALAELDEFVAGLFAEMDWIGTGSTASGNRHEQETKEEWLKVRTPIAALLRELEADKVDAERYRWLRAQLPGQVAAWDLTRLAAGLSAADAEIDAALAVYHAMEGKE